MSKKLIAVVPLWDEEKNSIWMIPGYLDGIREAGAVPEILPLTDDREALLTAFAPCDGLLMTGGQDVSPALYRATREENCGAPCEIRDRMEAILYANALEENKPVLGICRGIQLVNVLQGGTLYQDLPTEHPGGTEHHMSPPYDRPVHEVGIVNGTPLYELLGMERLGVNSYHHQAVKELGAELEVMAVSEDGLVEAVRHTGKSFVWAVQWHPELDFPVNQNSRSIFGAFVRACGQG
ncbi:MAG: gamma-glutamyl-gamma-aminobutyrate hydrolase family protein [Clostridiales bacterium]|nr:gamma-glutamyl-gamma-aminobutyrate hydrolase family protein [Clostridiales bacterium]